MKIKNMNYLGVVLALLSGAASAQTTQIDLAPYANYTWATGLAGSMAGNAGTSISSTTFNLLNQNVGHNVWQGSTTGSSVDIQTSIYGATSVQTLLNTFWGQSGLATVNLEFKGNAGANQTFTLYGNSDIRDFNDAAWTNTINGTTTQQWLVIGTTGRLDAQTFNLNSSFASQTLTDIVITAGAAGAGYSQPILSGVNVVAAPVPEPEILVLMLAGLGVVGVAKRRKAV